MHMQWYCTILDKSTLFAQLHPQGKGESKCRGLSVVPNETFEVHEREPPAVSRHCMCGLMLPLPVTPFCPFCHCGTCTVQCMHAYPQAQEVVVCLCEHRIQWLLCPVLSVSPAPCLYTHTHTHTHIRTHTHTHKRTHTHTHIRTHTNTDMCSPTAPVRVTLNLWFPTAISIMQVV